MKKLLLSAVAISCLSGCAMWGVVKKDIAPKTKELFIAAGPHLLAALIQDVASLIGKPVDFAEWGIGKVVPLPESETTVVEPAQ